MFLFGSVLLPPAIEATGPVTLFLLEFPYAVVLHQNRSDRAKKTVTLDAQG